MYENNIVSQELNIKNVPGEIISGMDSNVLNWLCDQSTHRYINELSASFANDLQQMEESVVGIDLPEDIEKQLNDIENLSVPKTTKQQMVATSTKFKQFLI